MQLAPTVSNYTLFSEAWRQGGLVFEYDANWKEIWALPAPAVWTAVSTMALR